MSPVRLDELDPQTRARVLAQLPGTETGTTALATVEKETFTTLGDPTTMTDDQLADIVIEGVKKIRRYLPYIVAMKARFDTGARDRRNRLKAPIKGCYSWKEFCKTRLDRAPQTIGEALAPEPQPNLNPVACTCPDCGASLPSRTRLRKHGHEDHNISVNDIATFLRRSYGELSLPAHEEIHWISKQNHCPTGKRGFDSIEDLYAARKLEGKPQPVAYIGVCGRCGQVHLDKDQRTDMNVHLNWYIPPEVQDNGEYLKKFFGSHTDDRPAFPADVHLSPAPRPAEPESPTPVEPSSPPVPHPLEELQKHLLRLRPALVDHNSDENQFVRALQEARSAPIPGDRHELARIDIRMMRELAAELCASADDIEKRAR